MGGFWGEKKQDLTLRGRKDPCDCEYGTEIERQVQAGRVRGLDWGGGNPSLPSFSPLLTCSLALLSSLSRAWASSSSRAQGTAESVAPTKGVDPDGKSLES